MNPAHTLIKRINARLRNALRNEWDSFASESFSQEGEDLILASFFGGLIGERKGIYVDVGAHHPWHLSNTAFFYLRGWSGLNIDPTPGTRKLFEKARPRDTTLEVAVGIERSTVMLHRFQSGEMNSLSASVAEARIAESVAIYVDQVQVDVFPLSDLIEQYLHPEQAIDFLNVDVEGLDLDVLKSNHWDRFRPTVVVVEDFESSIATGAFSNIENFLVERGYSMSARTRITSIFVRQDKLISTSVGPRLREENDRVQKLMQ
jgi:FkbM family methyltransferase